MLDIIITGGLIVDGSGSKGVYKDIGIQGDTISIVDTLHSLEAKKVIDATGCIVSPGFIDVHTHTDVSIQIDNRSESQLRQGVTTELVGLCGYGFAPCTDETRVKLLAAWEAGDISAVWHTFAEYLDAVEAASPATNIAALVSHGALRYMVMGGTCAQKATEEQITAMCKLLDASLTEGAYGFSTGLEYYPGKEAGLDELEKLCFIAANHQAVHATHVRNRDKYALHAFTEVCEIARNTKSRLQISHINPKYGRPDSTMRNTMAIIQRIRDDGCEIGMDVMPTNWNYTSAKALLPVWANDLPYEQLMDLLQSRAGRRQLAQNPSPIWQLPVDEKWERICLFNGRSTRRHVGKTLADIAQEYSCSGWDALCALLAEEGTQMGSLRLSGDSFFTEDIIEVLQDPFCAVCSDTISAAIDGPLAALRIAPHSYTWCEQYLRRFIRDQHALCLEEGIRRLTSLPASQIGLKKRGLLVPGYYADITLFKLDELADSATIACPNVYPQGIDTVIVNGVIALHKGQRNKHHSGLVLRAS